MAISKIFSDTFFLQSSIIALLQSTSLCTNTWTTYWQTRKLYVRLWSSRAISSNELGILQLIGILWISFASVFAFRLFVNTIACVFIAIDGRSNRRETSTMTTTSVIRECRQRSFFDLIVFGIMYGANVAFVSSGMIGFGGGSKKSSPWMMPPLLLWSIVIKIVELIIWQYVLTTTKKKREETMESTTINHESMKNK